MRKSLIIPALVAMLAVGCNKDGGSKIHPVPFLVDDVVAYYSENFEFELPEDMLPDYPSKNGDAVLTFDDSWMPYNGCVDVYVENTTKKEALAYVGAMVKAGWTLEETTPDDDDVVYTLSAFAEGSDEYYPGCVIYDYINSNDYVDIMFGAMPRPQTEFPAETVAALLEYYGTFAELPAPEFAAESYTVYGTQLKVEVGEGNEEGAISSYQGTLVAAEYVSAGPDQWGDEHYTSPNGELDVCIWDGNTASTPAPGFVYIDLEISVEFTYAKLDADLVICYPTFSHNAFPDTSESTFYFDSLVADSTLAATEAIASSIPTYLYEITAPEVQYEGTEDEMGFAQYTDEDMGFAISVYVFPSEGEFGGMITLQPVPESSED